MTNLQQILYKKVGLGGAKINKSVIVGGETNNHCHGLDSSSMNPDWLQEFSARKKYKSKLHEILTSYQKQVASQTERRSETPSSDNSREVKIDISLKRVSTQEGEIVRTL